MSEGFSSVQLVLRCGNCNKPFNKQSTLKRHGYYCRSRKSNNGVGASRARVRACLSCAKAKTRCDYEHPNCSRCVSKGVTCQYPKSLLNGNASKDPSRKHDRLTVEEEQTGSSSLLNPASTSSGESTQPGTDIALVRSNSQAEEFNEEYPVWDSHDLDLDFDFTEFMNTPTIDEIPNFLSNSSNPTTTQSQQFIDFGVLKLPISPSFAIRSLVPRQNPSKGMQRTTDLMFYTLKSYHRTLNQNILPPFIHPELITENFENNQMESLTNCVSMMHMISSGIHGSRKLFWRNVWTECERIYQDHWKFSRWGLLAAMQALCIYLLMRLDEGETEHNNIDAVLIAAVSVVAQQLAHSNSRKDAPSDGHAPSLKQSWKDWIYEESRRRLAIVYRSISMLVYFEPAAICTLQQDLVLAPLPAKKQLWEAGGERAWKAESERLPGVKTDFALAATGKLVEIDEGQTYGGGDLISYKPFVVTDSSGGTDRWEEWCSGMDGLGGLIMLAASMIV